MWIVCVIITGALPLRLVLLFFVQCNIGIIIYQAFCNTFHKNNPKFIARKASRLAKQEAIKNAYALLDKTNSTPEE